MSVFVEVKLHSDYSENQLNRYLEAIDPVEGQFLIAVTRKFFALPGNARRTARVAGVGALGSHRRRA